MARVVSALKTVNEQVNAQLLDCRRAVRKCKSCSAFADACEP